MDYQVILSEIFISDLKEIVESLTTRASPEVAFVMGNQLLDRALEAGRNPFLGQPVKRRLGARKVIRHPYLIYYDVDERRRTVEILRVRHGSRDRTTLRLRRGPEV